MKQFILKLLTAFIFGGLAAFAACTAPTATTSNATTQTSSPKPSNAAPETSVKTVLPNELKWNNAPNLSGVQNAVGVGDSTKPELYAMFGKMEKGAQFPAHSHPDARITTVISGTMYYAVGEKFDEASVRPYPAGSVVFTPAGMPHFMWAKDGETIMQETGYGPTGLNTISKSK